MRKFDFSNFAYNPSKINLNPTLPAKIKLPIKIMNDSDQEVDEDLKDNVFKSRFGRKLKKINEKSLKLNEDLSSSEEENLQDKNFQCRTRLKSNINKRISKKNKLSLNLSGEFKPLRKVNNNIFSQNSSMNDSKSDASKPFRIKTFNCEDSNSNDFIRKQVVDDIEILLNENNDSLSSFSTNDNKTKRTKDFSSDDDYPVTFKKFKKKSKVIPDSDEEDQPLNEKYIDDIKVIFDEENDDNYESDVDVLNSDDEQSEFKVKSSKETLNVSTIKENILNLLNEGSKDELLSISLLTNKVLDEIISLRPFNNWQDTLNKIENANYFSFDIIEKIQEHIKTKRVINYLMDECLKLSNKIKESVLDLKEHKEPKCMNKNLKLKPYQLIGLNWLVILYNQQINGILADEMGLGKTIQVISFFAYLRENKNINGPHLIVVPSSILSNWEREFQMWCPCIQVLKYHGNLQERADLRCEILSAEVSFEVLLTTYNMLYSVEDRKFLTRFKFKYAIFDEAHMLKNMKSTRFRNLFSIKAKNRLMLTGTPIQNNLLELISLLTFTVPNLFYSKLNYMENFFKNKKLDGNESNFVQQKTDQAKEILKPFILRRIKDNVMKDLPSKKVTYLNIKMTERQTELYKEIVNKCSNLIKLKKQKLEEKKKKAEDVLVIENKSRKRNKVEYNIDKIFEIKDEEKIVIQNEDSNDILIEEEFKLNDDKKNESVTSILMELRKCSNHPLLIRKLFTDDLIVEIANVLKQKEPFYQKDGNLNYMIEDMQMLNDFDLHMLCKKFSCIEKYKLKNEEILNSGKFVELGKMLNKIINQDKDKLLIFSQFVMMLDIIQEYLNIKSIRYCRLDGSTKVNERMNIIDGFSDTDINVFLLTTKAGGVGINLVEANNVIIHDIDFNPFNDKQAEDRVHRLGQVKEVNVFKFVSEDTVEEHMKATCIEKLKIGMKITSDKIENQDKNEKSDVKYLLKQALKL